MAADTGRFPTNLATELSAGAMSAADKTKLNTLYAGVRRRKPRVLGAEERIVSFADWEPSVSGTSTVTLNDSDHYGSGTTCALLHTDGDNGTCQISSTVLTDTIDLTNGLVLVAMKFTNASVLSSTPFTIYLGSDAEAGTYSNYLKWNLAGSGGVSVARYNQPDGEWLLVPLRIVAAQTTGSPVTTAITQIRIKLTSSAGTATDVRVGAIMLAKNAYWTFPNGAVAFTFDDGRDGQFTYARQSLNARGIQGTFYLVDQYLGSDDNNYMTLAQAQQLRAEGHVIGYHAATTAAHVSRYPGIGAAAAAADLRASFANHLAWGLELAGEPRHFAWPGGEWDNATWAAVSALGLTSMRLTGGTAAIIDAFPPVDSRKIVAASSSAALTTLALKKAYIDAVKAQKAFGVFAEHQIFADATSASGTNWKEFNELLDYTISAGVAIIGMAEATEQ